MELLKLQNIDPIITDLLTREKQNAIGILLHMLLNHIPTLDLDSFIHMAKILILLLCYDADDEDD